MIASIATEADEMLDVLSCSLGYLGQRPFKCTGYAAVAWLLGIPGSLVTFLLAAGVVLPGCLGRRAFGPGSQSRRTCRRCLAAIPGAGRLVVAFVLERRRRLARSQLGVCLFLDGGHVHLFAFATGRRRHAVD